MKVLSVDPAQRRIWLSLKAALPPKEPEPEPAEAEEPEAPARPARPRPTTLRGGLGAAPLHFPPLGGGAGS